MPWPKGMPRPPDAGRKKGTKNKDSRLLKEQAEKYGVDVFEILVLFAGGKWQELGYDKETQTKSMGGGETYEVRIITPEIRLKAAADACQYLHPKLKTIEATIRDTGNKANPANGLSDDQLENYEKVKGITQDEFED